MVNLSGFRPENVLFGGRIKVKETLKRTQAGLAHGSVAARDAAVLASSAALSGPGATLTTGATLLATDGFAAGKANQMLVGMLNFSNAPQTAQLLAQNHNLAMVGGASLGLASLYASKYPIGFLNRQAASLANLYPNVKKTPELETVPAAPVAPALVPAITNKPVAIVPPASPVSEPPKPATPEPTTAIAVSPAIVPSPATIVSPAPVALPTENPILVKTDPVAVTAEQPLSTAELPPTELQPAETPPVKVSEAAQTEAENAGSKIVTEPAILLPNQTQGRVRKALSRLYTPVEFLMGKMRRNKKTTQAAATEASKSEAAN
jgi:hypothetical protein